MIRIRRARPADAAAIAAVHVSVWRSTYPGLLPDTFLANLSTMRIAAGYQRGLFERRNGEAMFVAVFLPDAEEEKPRIVGFASGARCRGHSANSVPAEGEIETLYVLDDWRDRGIGRRLMRAAAAHLVAIGCGSVMLWVLSGNPSRWFYERLGGKPVAHGYTLVGGRSVAQTALLWNPIERLIAATARADGA